MRKEEFERKEKDDGTCGTVGKHLEKRTERNVDECTQFGQYYEEYYYP